MVSKVKYNKQGISMDFCFHFNDNLNVYVIFGARWFQLVRKETQYHPSYVFWLR